MFLFSFSKVFSLGSQEESRSCSQSKLDIEGISGVALTCLCVHSEQKKTKLNCSLGPVPVLEVETDNRRHYHSAQVARNIAALFCQDCGALNGI